ncbi:MAG: ribonuclease inhibitor [Verrucomicrobia bacterium]|nr:ribonuclease inhibitor [Verrucomicrobiota bacterium]
MSNATEMGLFFGRLHPLLVHLPIGLIVLLMFLELLARFPRFKQATANAGVILALTVPAAAFSVLCGWLLSGGEGYQERLLQWHKWTGIGTACVCALAALLYWLNFKQAYRWCLFCSFFALLLASHYGGSLTHGSDYLARYAPAPLRTWLGGDTPVATAPPKPKDIDQLPVFAEVIQPALLKNCVSCHGPEKLKGKLRLDSLQALLKGGGSGPAIVPGKAAESELVRRLKLPTTSDDHMPPEGKPQPSSDEIALLEWWIDSGAPAAKKLAELKPSASIKRILGARFGSPVPAVKVVQALPLDQVLPLATDLAEQLHIALSPLSPKDPWLQCNASIGGTNFGDAQLARLAPIAPNLRWLDLAGTGLTDAGAAQVGAMHNLARLHLERTAITDAGLAALQDLPELEYLNLYGTSITDAGLDRLRELPKLKQVFLWQTQVTPPAAKAFLQARTDTNQLQHWQEEIHLLQAKIQDARISVDLGTELAAAPATNAAPVNANCPVSGKPIDPTKTVLREGVLVAFCCDNCKAKFEQDPKPFLAKLGPFLPKDPPTQTGK